MSAVAPAIAFGAFIAGLFAWRRSQAAAPAPALWAPMATVDEDPGYSAQQIFPGLTVDQAPPPDNSREQRNVAAFLLMIRFAEGTAKEGGYGALFGWPAAGRSFNPDTATGHPKVFFKYTNKAGQVLNVSPAGAYQIIWTTWSTYYVPFVAWAAINGYTVSGFSPATQDAFAIYLLDLDGALGHVKAGRLDQALAIAKRRWASLPGAGYNQPERARSEVFAAYTNAGGTVA